MLKKTLGLVAASAATVVLSTGIAGADPAPAPGPDPKAPKCAGYGGDDGTKFQVTPCGWRYGDERGWYQVPPDGPMVIDGQ